MRLKLLTLALALAAISLPSHGEDLLDAYRDARANDPVLSQADATRLATGEGVDQARALLLPQIGASMSLNQTNGGNQIGHSRSRSINGTLSQTVLDFSKYANLKAAHSASDAQDELYQAAAQELYGRVAAAYFGVLTSEDWWRLAIIGLVNQSCWPATTRSSANTASRGANPSLPGSRSR